MNRKLTVLFAFASCMALAAVAPVSAQDRVTADIPFAFNVGAKALPAGSYELRRLTDAAVAIKNVDTRECATALVMRAQPKDLSQEAELVFHQYGGSHFLSGIWTRDSRRELPMSKLERREASKAAESADNRSDARVTYIAARER